MHGYPDRPVSILVVKFTWFAETPLTHRITIESKGKTVFDCHPRFTF